jgi:hypothetical protein
MIGARPLITNESDGDDWDEVKMRNASCPCPNETVSAVLFDLLESNLE